MVGIGLALWQAQLQERCQPFSFSNAVEKYCFRKQGFFTRVFWQGSGDDCGVGRTGGRDFGGHGACAVGVTVR